MFLQPFEITRKSIVSDIVAGDYRTAGVFKKFGIGYCCGGKWPIDIACKAQDVNPEQLQVELEKVIRTNQVSNHINFSEYSTEFVLDYIINVHHGFLKKTLTTTQEMLADFAKGHVKKYAFLNELEIQFERLCDELLIAMKNEEEKVFPYIRHLLHAYKHRESYAPLMIKTLRKPVENVLFNSHETVSGIILSIRNMANSYQPPENACINHKVVLASLKELDNDVMQHLYLEQTIVFPKVMAIESELSAQDYQ